MTLLADERRRFRCRLTSPDMAVTFVQSLYLPGVSPSRRQAAERVAQRWVGKELGVPLRRIVARAEPRQ
ncbi:MAG: hypothetical protein ACRD0D_11400 [Acidimicrobiales bacterium]